MHPSAVWPSAESSQQVSLQATESHGRNSKQHSYLCSHDYISILWGQCSPKHFSPHRKPPNRRVTHQHTSHVCWATFTVFLLCLRLCRSIDATFANMMSMAAISIGLWDMTGVVWLHYSCGRSADQLRDIDLARWFSVGTKNPLVSPTAC